MISENQTGLNNQAENLDYPFETTEETNLNELATFMWEKQYHQQQNSNHSQDSEIEVSLADAIQFFWKIRKIIVVAAVVGIVIIGSNFIISEFRSADANSGNFSSINLDRVESGTYRLRVEAFGDRSTPKREDVLVDFDRKLNITIQNENEILSLKVENLNDEIVVERIRIRGRLRNRSSDDFYLVDTTHDELQLMVNEVSRGVRLVSYQTNESFSRIVDNWVALRDLDEFRYHFELELVDLDFQFLDSDGIGTGLITLRYISIFDEYIIREDQRIVEEAEEPEEIEEEPEEEPTETIPTIGIINASETSFLHHPDRTDLENTIMWLTEGHEIKILTDNYNNYWSQIEIESDIFSPGYPDTFQGFVLTEFITPQ